MEKEKLLNLLLSELFNAVTEDDLLQVKGDNIFRGTEPLSKSMVLQYATEARSMQKMSLYKAMQKHFQGAANQKMYLSSESVDDLTFGKATLWNMRTYHNKIVAIGNITETNAPQKEPDMKPVSPKKKS